MGAPAQAFLQAVSSAAAPGSKVTPALEVGAGVINAGIPPDELMEVATA
jgi:hypothetical protein